MTSSSAIRLRTRVAAGPRRPAATGRSERGCDCSCAGSGAGSRRGCRRPRLPPSPSPHLPPRPPPCTPAARLARAARGRRRARAAARGRAATAVDEILLGGVAAAMALVKAYRMHGHLAARLDPLGSEPMGDPALDESRLVPSLTPELQARIPASLLRLYVEGDTLLEALPLLRAVYTGSIAYEIEHISDHAERVWLRQAIESGRFRQPLEPEERQALLHRLSEAEGFEQYLRRSFLGQKQFSLEGLESLVPMLDETIGLAAAGGAHEVVIGMAHRGRLNALVHTVGRSYQSILREFEGERSLDALVVDPEGGTGDVKYHLPASGTRVTPAGEIDVTIVPNPSHLEAADPVVEGRARAEQTDRSGGAGIHDPSVALPVLIHGDAAFPGQGVVAETLEPAVARGLCDGRHAPPDHEQPGRLHDRSDREPLHPLLERPGQGLRRADRARQRRRSRGGALGRAARARLPDRVRPRLRDRPRRLPALRAQRAGRRVVHAAADGRADPAAADGARPSMPPGSSRKARSRRTRRRRSSPRSPRRCARRTSSCGRRSARPRLPRPSRPSPSGLRRRATRSSRRSPPTGCAR